MWWCGTCIYEKFNEEKAGDIIRKLTPVEYKSDRGSPIVR